MKIGVLGGSFDPIHYGHLVAAQEALMALKLSRVIFVPAGQPPHKLHRTLSDPEARLEMVNIAISSNPGFESSRIDIDRPGPHYSVDTVKILRHRLGSEAEIFFIVGLDSLLDMGTWRDPQQLLMLCRLVGVTRPGYPRADLQTLDARIQRWADRIIVLPIPEMNISSSGLRQRVRDVRPIKYQLPEGVEEYIFAKGLYKDGGSEE
ncbi:MAG: nicotinate-nucleotide adenylyltransferase [Chloroflexi bacterium]|nr:nicotinate-nucleotide adenylyltransferase [Chloroflexota bacterium]